MKTKWTTEIIEDPDIGDLFLLMPDDVVEMLGLQEGDEIEWTDNADGTYTVRRAE